MLNTSVNDKVIVAYSGHGLVSKNYNYYLSTYNVDFNNPQNGGIPYDVLESLLDSIPSRKKLLLIDACHSGELDEESTREIESSKKLLTKNYIATKGEQKVLYKEDGMGLKNSIELMRNLFLNVSQNTGAYVIAAASGTQFALEKSDIGNGVFSHSILECMKKK